VDLDIEPHMVKDASDDGLCGLALNQMKKTIMVSPSKNESQKMRLGIEQSEYAEINKPNNQETHMELGPQKIN